MLKSWRRRCRRNSVAMPPELTIPNHFLCPISLHLMKDPVTLSTGTTYDRHSIETWIESGNKTCPVTNQLLRDLEPIPNHAIRKIIQEWCVENRSRGVDRIPTPRIPITSAEASEMLSRVSDEKRCIEFVAKIKQSAKESDRNKRCFVANGSSKILSAAFAANSNSDESADVLTEVLSAMITLTPVLDEETSRNLSSENSVQKLVWFMRFGSLSMRRNAVLALRSILSFQIAVEMEGVVEALIGLIKEPICPTTTKASLLSIYYLLKSHEHCSAIAVALMEMGMVEKLLEMAVESDKSVTEKALGVLEGMCGHGEVRERARENALMIPLLVKKVLRVSEMATEFSVSILLKIVREEEESAVEALRAGAFQKLLLVLQIGSDEGTKEKVTELLKVLNGYRSRIECVESSDFKHITRPF
ncbi:U-box domain-containing protein 21-like [Salvia hispanica]|uniref:U-box domain-containing protein 21-like n=1 Tax=Salvia hispanica TaxID=49212 RepID=UPI0020099046|nr:U-box domain-containing protein 21-like [Salvia hispanica]